MFVGFFSGCFCGEFKIVWDVPKHCFECDLLFEVNCNLANTSTCIAGYSWRSQTRFPHN